MSLQIPNERIAHMHGVAEWMYEHAEEYGCEKDKMYLLGLVHDIGYLYGSKEDHECKGAELLGSEDIYLARFVRDHGLTPQEYMDCTCCFDFEIPKEMILLWTADMTVDLHGNAVGFEARLDDIKKRHGINSESYRICKETMSWLKNHKAQ